MTEEQANILRDELNNPPVYNTQKQEVDIEARINNAPKSKWLIEFEAICFQDRFKKRDKRWWRFWRSA